MALYHPGGMQAFLESQGVKLTRWKPSVRKMTEELKAHVQALAAEAGRTRGRARRPTPKGGPPSDIRDDDTAG